MRIFGRFTLLSLIAGLLITFLVFTEISAYEVSQAIPKSLEENYVKSLYTYEGANYAPYGDSTGISCSTLVREALAHTNGLNLDVRAQIRHADCSSVEMKKGCNNLLSFVLSTKNLYTVDYSQLQLGDIAILGNETAIHSMAYIGNKQWIHADPIAGKVVKFGEVDEDYIWYTYKVTIMRWNVLKN